MSKKNTAARATDALTQLQREFDWDDIVLRRFRERIAAEDETVPAAILRVRECIKHLGNTLVTALLRQHPDAYPSALHEVTARQAIIATHMGLTLSDALELFAKAPCLLACSVQSFSQIVQSITTILPTTYACRRFLFAYPDACTLPPASFDRVLKQRGWMVAWRRTPDAAALFSANADACEKQQRAMKQLWDVLNDSKPPKPDIVLRGGGGRPRQEMLLSDAFRACLQAVYHSTKEYERSVGRILRVLGSEEAAVTTLQTLLNAGWRKKALKHFLHWSHGVRLRNAGLERVLELQRAAEQTGIPAPEAAELVAFGSAVLRYSQAEILDTMRDLSADACRKLLKRMQRGGPLTLPATTPRPERPAALTLDNLAEAPWEDRVTHIVRLSRNAPSPLDAFLCAGWDLDEAQAHLRAFSLIQRIPPVVLTSSLIQLRLYVDGIGSAWTQRLQRARARLMRSSARLWGQPVSEAWSMKLIVSIHALAAHGFDPLDERRDRADNLRRAIETMVSLKGFPHAKDKTHARSNFQRARHTFMRMPEWMAHQFRALRTAQTFKEAYQLSARVMYRNLCHPQHVLVLLEPPKQIHTAIRFHRQLMHQYVDRDQQALHLDVLAFWRRLCVPFSIVRARWQVVMSTEDGVTALHADPRGIADALYARTDAAFRARLAHTLLRLEDRELDPRDTGFVALLEDED